MQEVGRDKAKGGNMGIERLAGKKDGRDGGYNNNNDRLTAFDPGQPG